LEPEDDALCEQVAVDVRIGDIVFVNDGGDGEKVSDKVRECETDLLSELDIE
jgi:hypothetical protein